MVRVNRIWNRASACWPLLWLLIVPVDLCAATVTVKTDRNPVSLEESFQIVFEAQGAVDDDPDFSPLNRSFQILGTSQNRNFSIINGSVNRSKTWTLSVLARHAGNLTIPSIRFGKDLSPAATVAVQAGAAPNRNQNQGQGDDEDEDVFIEVTAVPLNPYVQSQVKYKLKLYRAVATPNASLNEPQASGGNAVVERIGEDKNYETVVNGKRYLVVERDYAVYPQASGDVTIGAVQFQGQVSRGGLSLFDPFGPQPKTIARQSAPVTLQVRPIPGGFTGSHWLPARDLKVTEDWPQDPPVFRAGEPVTRTLTITADGLTASQLPEIPKWDNAAFKQYPDQPLLDDRQAGAGTIGSRQEKIAIIPNQPGDFVLPEIRLPWWNTATDQQELAVIPERRIQILPAVGGAVTGSPDLQPVPLTKSEPSVPGNTILAEQAGLPVTNAIPAQGSPSLFWKGLSAGLAAGWLLTVVVWWLTRRRGATPVNGAGAVALKLAQVLKELKQVCSDNHPQRAKELLLQWGRLNWPDAPALSIGAIGKRSGAGLALEIQLLSNKLYGKTQAAWNGGQFWQVFQDELSHDKKPQPVQKGKLEPLFKI